MGLMMNLDESSDFGPHSFHCHSCRSRQHCLVAAKPKIKQKSHGQEKLGIFNIPQKGCALGS